MKQITERVFGLLTAGGFMNAYIISGADGLTVVDTLLDASYLGVLERGLAQMGQTMADVKRLFLTHCHYDHVGGAPALQAKLNVTTYAHRADALVIRGAEAPHYANPAELNWVNKQIHRVLRGPGAPVRVDVLLQGDETLDEVAPGAQVVALPGHSYGQVGLYLPSEKTLLAGDMCMIYPTGIAFPIRAASPDWMAVQASIRHAATLPMENLMVGHGRPIVGGAQARLQDFVAKLA